MTPQHNVFAMRGDREGYRVRAADVAAYVLGKIGPTSAMKLQKLVYYCQAYSLAWDGRPLFDDRIEAWAAGPVVRRLYAQHRGLFTVGPSDILGDGGALDNEQRATVDNVLSFFAHMSAQELSARTHTEIPWLAARKGLPEGSPSMAEIPHGALFEYYSKHK